jgi:ABC-type glycerol-3-phosphate transport system permease component
VVPFLYLVSIALRPESEYQARRLGLPLEPTGEHFAQAWRSANLGQAIVNSVIACTIGALVLAVVSVMAGYWFLLRDGPGSRFVLGLITAAWVIPFAIYVIPLFVQLADLGLLNNLVILGFVYAGINVPFGTGLMYSYMRRGIPQSVREAGRVDGASDLQELLRIILPLSRPAIGTLVALGFVWSWGDLLLSLVLMQESSKYTATVASAGLVRQFDASTQTVAAAALVTLVPVVVVFGFAQRAIRRGILEGIGK